MYFKSEEEIKLKLKKLNLIKIWDYIKSYIRPTIDFGYKKKDDIFIEIGCSKIGGCPDLPENIEWPKFYDHTQSFIAQINLKDLKKYDVENLLPDKGILYFFYDLFSYTKEKDETGKAGTVIFNTTESNLTRKNPPEEILLEHEKDYKPELIFKSAIINKFSSGLTIPFVDHIVMEELEEKDIISQDELYENYLEGIFDEENSKPLVARMLGNSENKQNEMETTCFYLTKNGKIWWQLDDQEKKQEKEYLNGWILLFQIWYIKELKLNIHDGGAIYYWIHKDDLKEKRFDKVLAIMQSG